MRSNRTNIIWNSSYEKNNYGDFFYTLMRIYKPDKVVELGTKTGYSAYHMAKGLDVNGKGTIDCYDLWENLLNNQGQSGIFRSIAEANLKEFEQIVKLNLAEATNVHKKYDTVDILHVDLDNDGGILEKVVPAWIDKVRQIIIIEGGSNERDKIDLETNYKRMLATEWIDDLDEEGAKDLKKIISNPSNTQFVTVVGDAKYKKIPITSWLKEFKTRRGDIEYVTIEPFPSLTIIRKKT